VTNETRLVRRGERLAVGDTVVLADWTGEHHRFEFRGYSDGWLALWNEAKSIECRALRCDVLYAETTRPSLCERRQRALRGLLNG
jgi:hypothetical protein